MSKNVYNWTQNCSLSENGSLLCETRQREKEKEVVPSFKFTGHFIPGIVTFHGHSSTKAKENYLLQVLNVQKLYRIRYNIAF